MADGTLFLETAHYELGTLTVAEIDGGYRRWLNDPEVVQHNSHGRFPQTPQTLRAYVESTTQRTSEIVLAIRDKETGRHIGNISLQAINWVDRSAEMAFLLGEKEYWGRGVMLECGLKLLDHAFRTLNLHRVHCGTSSANEAMQKLALKLGMQQEGVRREAIYNGGRYFDVIEYGVLNPADVSPGSHHSKS